MNVEERVVVITGAGRGIGWAAAEEFQRRGAKLALLDLSAEGLQARVQQSNLADCQVRCYGCDVSNEAQVIQTFERIARDFGRLDVLINNAGITRDALLVKVENCVVTGRMSEIHEATAVLFRRINFKFSVVIPGVAALFFARTKFQLRFLFWLRLRISVR